MVLVLDLIVSISYANGYKEDKNMNRDFDHCTQSLVVTKMSPHRGCPSLGTITSIAIVL